jgi:hypothetical protein
MATRTTDTVALPVNSRSMGTLQTTNVYYKMRGYYGVGSVYETWVEINAPDTTPPSGHVLSNVVIVSSWSVVS